MTERVHDRTEDLALESPRLLLRPCAPADFLALIEGVEAFYASFGLPAADGLRDFIVSAEVSPQWLEQLRTAPSTDVWTHGFAIIDRASRTVIGNAGFKGVPDAQGMVEIAYGVVPAFENRGIAAEAAGMLVTFAFADSRVRLVRAHTLPGNAASGRVLLKNGFTNVGEVVDPDDGLVCRWERTRPPCEAR